MSYHYPGLVARNRLFYFRLKIPVALRKIARCTEMVYSLNTSIYQEAIEKWRVEFAHLQAFLTIFKDIIMKVNEQKQLVLNRADVDKLLLHRLEQIQEFLENNTDEIKSRHKTEADIILFPNGKKEADIRKLMQDMILDYLKGLVDKNKANITLRSVYNQLRNKEIELGLVGKDSKYDWLKEFSTHIAQLDHYAKKAVKAERDNKLYTPRNAKVITLLRSYDAMKTDERIHHSMAATHWKKFFKKFAQIKRNIKGTDEKRIDRIENAIHASFALMGREHIEDITKQDCRTLCERIYRLPKRWLEKLSSSENILDILTDNTNLTLSRKTIKSYLEAFKAFMRYAVKEDIIENSLNDFIDMPVKIDGLKRSNFTTEELRIIFNPKTYPNPHNRKYVPRFWIPIIALYHGARQNEICQLDVDDIVQEKGIPCISINNRGDDKSLKNEGSNRVIPIHPKLLDMGFLLFVEYQRKNKQKKLFNTLSKTKHKGYSKIIQQWFNRYLDNHGITGKDKVFHSFRHTFETMAVEKRIPAEYQNAICGWREQGIGQRLYAHKKDMRIMLEEISKIEYPINRELNELKKEFMDSYVVK
ncbi:MAG: site-specific integrase [Pseudomonadota bacterium]|nr:site-specific integrase [Pseudomonadota bacterium]